MALSFEPRCFVDGRGAYHEMRIDTDPQFGLICTIDGTNALALAAYFDRGSAREEAIERAKRRSDR